MRRFPFTSWPRLRHGQRVLLIVALVAIVPGCELLRMFEVTPNDAVTEKQTAKKPAPPSKYSFRQAGPRLRNLREFVAMIQCPACQGDLPEWSRFCPACGVALEASAMQATGSYRSGSATESVSTEGLLRSSGLEHEPRFLPGMTLLGRYRIITALGKGGMGMVFLAEDPELDRRVALKVMLPRIAANPSAKQRFLREARAAAKLKSDHIVTIFQVAED